MVLVLVLDQWLLGLEFAATLGQELNQTAWHSLVLRGPRRKVSKATTATALCTLARTQAATREALPHLAMVTLRSTFVLCPLPLS